MLSAVPSSLCELCLILLQPLWGRYYWQAHFPDEETETQGAPVPCLGLSSSSSKLYSQCLCPSSLIPDLRFSKRGNVDAGLILWDGSPGSSLGKRLRTWVCGLGQVYSLSWTPRLLSWKLKIVLPHEVVKVKCSHTCKAHILGLAFWRCLVHLSTSFLITDTHAGVERTSAVWLAGRFRLTTSFTWEGDYLLLGHCKWSSEHRPGWWGPSLTTCISPFKQ